jgi:molecular chaperone DnaJ
MPAAVRPRSKVQADHYAILGVAVAAGAAEIRRAYRRLALRFHPDRAGPEATAQFQQISEAYRILSDAQARAYYDAGRAAPADTARDAWARAGSGVGAGTDAGNPSDPDFAGVYRERRHVTFGGSGRGPDVIDRLSGPLEELVAAATARRNGDGSIDLVLNTTEVRRGGTAAITLPCLVPCPTCGGVAQKNRLWCARCEFAGTVVDQVTICISIPRHVAEGTAFRVAVDPTGSTPSLRLRIRYQ